MPQGKFARALVTGGAGFIGSHIARLLLEKGLEVNVLDDLSAGRPENLPEGVRFYHGSVLDAGLLRKTLRGVDCVFHNAAKVSIRNSFENVLSDAETNVLGTVSLLKASGEMRIKRFILASSMAVYSFSAALPINEDSPLEGSSPYGVGKIASEKYAFQLARYYGFDCIALRYFNTFGPHQTFTPYVGVITIFIRSLLEGRRPVIYGGGEQTRDFVYVEDVARANILAMEKPASNCAINIATGSGTTVNEVASLLIERLAPGIRPIHDKPRLGEPGDSVADISLAKRLLGFVPRWTIKDKIDAVIDWNRSLLARR